jgi:F-type H+-transporting ATPase subunit delta
MPLIESQPDALSQVYARSLFELAEAKGGRPTIESSQAELEDILELARADARFSEFLASRVLPVAERSRSLEKIFGGRVSDLVLRFLQVLNEKGRLGHLPAIGAAYDRIVQDKFGRVEVDLYTASPASREEIEQVKGRLQRALGKEPVIHAYTDPAMIGGLKLQIGDRLIDGSIATRLRQMREQLTSEGSTEIRARAERLIDNA